VKKSKIVEKEMKKKKKEKNNTHNQKHGRYLDGMKDSGNKFKVR